MSRRRVKVALPVIDATDRHQSVLGTIVIGGVEVTITTGVGRGNDFVRAIAKGRSVAVDLAPLFVAMAERVSGRPRPKRGSYGAVVEARKALHRANTASYTDRTTPITELRKRWRKAIAWLRKVQADRVEALGAMLAVEAVASMSHAELGRCLRRRSVPHESGSGARKMVPRGTYAKWGYEATAEIARRREVKKTAWLQRSDAAAGNRIEARR